MIEVHYYIATSGKNVVDDWIAGLGDPRTEAKILARIDRLEGENFGNYKSLGGGLSELRIDSGPGYRIYYAMTGRTCVLLLCAGDKRRQAVDIRRAREYFKDYLERTQKI